MKVRYVGGQSTYSNPILYLLIGRTGVIQSVSSKKNMDWFVEMDEGCYDIDAQSWSLVPIENNESDIFLSNQRSLKHAEHYILACDGRVLCQPAVL